MTPRDNASVIVVPGTAETNSGDQALLAEAVEVVREAGWEGPVYVIGDRGSGAGSSGGHDQLHTILPHPRRGHRRSEDQVHAGAGSRLRMMLNAARDWLWGSLLLQFASSPPLARLLVRGPQRESYEEFRRARMIVVKGGGFLHAYGEMTAPYYIWYQLFYLRLALRLGKPVVVLPNSFGPFEGATVESQMRSVLSRCSFVSARESESARALGEVLGREVPMFPDMAYQLTPEPASVGEDICRRHSVPLGSKPCVAFTVRPYRFPGAADPLSAFDAYIDAITDLVRHVSDRGYYPVLVTHVAGPSAHEDDRIAIRRVIEALGDVPHSWIDEALDCRTIKAVYGCMDFLVGTRFHSVIFAQAQGVPCMAIAYGGNKATGAMGDMGLSDYVVPIGEVTGPALCGMFDSLVENREMVVEKSARYIAEARDRMQILREQIARHIAWDAGSEH